MIPEVVPHNCFDLTNFAEKNEIFFGRDIAFLRPLPVRGLSVSLHGKKTRTTQECTPHCKGPETTLRDMKFLLRDAKGKERIEWKKETLKRREAKGH